MQARIYLPDNKHDTTIETMRHNRGKIQKEKDIRKEIGFQCQVLVLIDRVCLILSSSLVTHPQPSRLFRCVKF